jgi:hypothetical protein
VTVTRQPGLPFGDDDPVRRALTQPGRLLFNPPDRMRLGQTVPVEVRLTRSLKLDAELLEGLKGPGKSKLEPIKTSSRMAVTLTGDGFDVKRRNSDEEQDVDEDEITMWEFGVTAKKPGKQQLFMSVSLRFEVSGQPLVRKNIPVYEVPISVRVTVPALAGAVIRDPKYLVTTLVAIAAVIIAAIFH